GDIPHFAKTLLLEFCIPDGQYFVYDEDFRIEMSCNGESQPHIHARRVSFYRGVKKPFDTGEIDDGIKRAFDLLVCHSKYRAIQINVFTTGQLRVKSRS